MKVLVIDDDKNLIELILDTFEIAWPEATVITANSGLAGLRLVDVEKPDIILLDLGLPDVSGYEVAKRIRNICETPIMIISARDEESNIVKAFNIGADEYLTKPFGQLELIARIKAIAKRIMKKEIKTTVSFLSLHLNTNSNELIINGQSFRLSNTEKEIMYCLLKKQGQVVTNHDLAVLFFGPNPSGGEQAIKTYIYRLRKKVEKDYHSPQIILTQSGVGYYLNSDL